MPDKVTYSFIFLYASIQSLIPVRSSIKSRYSSRFSNFRLFQTRFIVFPALNSLPAGVKFEPQSAACRKADTHFPTAFIKQSHVIGDTGAINKVRLIYILEKSNNSL